MRSASDPVILGPAGLSLSGNTFSASPQGAMSKARNVVISQKGVAQPRNGQEHASTLPVAADLPFSVVEFQQAILVNYGTSKNDTAMGLGRVNAGAITAYGGGPYNPVGDTGGATDYGRMKFVLAELFLHFCTQAGPKVLETFNGTPRKAGLSRVPDFTSVLMRIPTGTQPGIVPYNSSVAFRYAHKRIASTGQVQTSPVSNRFVVTNRFLAPAGSISRAGAVVTAVIPQVIGLFSPMGIGSTITLSPGEANFPAGAKVLTGAAIGDATITLTWNEAGAAASSTLDQEVMPGTSGAVYVRANIALPRDAVAGDFVQLFKSVATSTSSIEPSADVYLCDEHLITAADVIAGTAHIDSYTPESALQAPAYTNPSDGDGDGEQGQNFPPPIYLDVANFDSNTFYLSTTGQQYLELQLLGVGGPNGVQDGDTITLFDGVATTTTYTFRTAPGVITDIRLISGGTPSFNMAWTTYFLCSRLGSDFAPVGVGVFGEATQNGVAGGFRIERTDYLQTPFQVKVSRPESWTPALQSAVYTNSFANKVPNGLTWSKDGQSEAVPVINQDVVGVANYYARRCFGLKNALIILKEGDGIWSYTGSGNYNLQQISKANLIAPDCACVFFDSVWAYTDQGILRISDTGGVTVMSRPIETELNRLATLLPAETYAWSFAVAYETERRVMFFVPVDFVVSDGPDRPVLAAYCYSEATNAWTGPLDFNEEPISGLVSTGHKLWLGAYDPVFTQGRITSERKTGSYLDVAEAEWPNVLTTTANPLVVQLATAGALREGSGVSQTINGTLYRTKVAAVNADGTYTLAETVPWVSGACTVYDPYPVEPQFLPEGSPGIRKALTRLFTLYKPEAFSSLFGRTTLQTDQVQAELEIDTPAPGFGSTPFGSGSFGNPSPMVVDVNPIDAQWVNAAQFFPGMKFDEVWCQMKLQGVGMKIDAADAPAGRGK